MIKGILDRIVSQDKQTLGWFTLYDGVKPLITCAVLELANNGNQTSISNICAGEYWVKKRYSHTFGWHFILLDVEAREYILIHKGNYYTDTEGCLIFGHDFTDINGDDYLDVTSSKVTMDKLLEIAPDKWKLIINNN
jgi:hypothetical protein